MVLGRRSLAAKLSFRRDEPAGDTGHTRSNATRTRGPVASLRPRRLVRRVRDGHIATVVVSAILTHAIPPRSNDFEKAASARQFSETGAEISQEAVKLEAAAAAQHALDPLRLVAGGKCVED